MGDLETEHPWAARIADGAGAVVISVGYRLAPENRFPAALDDAYAVLTWVAEHAAELGIAPERIAIGGHSAGAGLAAAVTLRTSGARLAGDQASHAAAAHRDPVVSSRSVGFGSEADVLEAVPARPLDRV
ncbi:alpha/beta hydrolase fold domain-containing protein [Streptomyces roseifaciens]|uniref:alpha/beta hydrolase fold domain-containing protein n=1 Tax=Streptomyces roseifaciens TaxID=1488406 RepID=UPI000717E6A7